MILLFLGNYDTSGKLIVVPQKIINEIYSKENRILSVDEKGAFVVLPIEQKKHPEDQFSKRTVLLNIEQITIDSKNQDAVRVTQSGRRYVANARIHPGTSGAPLVYNGKILGLTQSFHRYYKKFFFLYRR